MKYEPPKGTKIHNLLQPHGLLLLGVMRVSDEDRVPDIAEAQPARKLLLIGNGGSLLWPVFRRSSEFRDGLADPLDRWSKRVGENLATELGGRAIFPFEGPPYTPFLSWAGKTGQVQPSAVSMFMHEKFGLWHAYRFAIALSEQQDGFPAEATFNSPCPDCKDQPCLKVCPVNAFTVNSYRVEKCMEYLVTDPKTACRRLGCEARRACPVGREHIYLPSHAKFHMDAFVESHDTKVD